MIEIVYARLLVNTEEPNVWFCWLEVSNEGTFWMLPATAPESLTEGELQAYFDSQEEHLWGVAQRKQHYPRLCGNVPTSMLVRPLMLALLDEINFLRNEQGHGPLTEGDLLTSVKNHLGAD